MFCVEATVRINAPANRIFEVLIDPQAYPRWIPDVVRVEAEGRLVGGARFGEVTLFRGREGESTTVKWRSEVATTGLMRLLEPMLPGEFKRRQSKYLTLLKAEVEGLG